ncbi:unnamed protein product [Vitrella brassicaformis CCMP3155]|uniref:Uncharacterized protein n=3 Tax=Vitrella brassicaformis TaxID=1169539 RepID=A0A0G4G4J7_VITBC|nr:unnamed protein product [Vitrella brassicaformis CCMP3155]|eukprot:CEM23185.1 unnamed protein product [Vitrella brassicaformis CCMP3155]
MVTSFNRAAAPPKAAIVMMALRRASNMLSLPLLRGIVVLCLNEAAAKHGHHHHPDDFPTSWWNSFLEFLSSLSVLQYMTPVQMLICGAIMTVTGATMCCLGSHLQKAAGLNTMIPRDGTFFDRHVGYIPRIPWRWWWGMIIYISGNAVHMLALAFAPASVLSPMNSVSLFFSAIIGSVMHGELLGSREWLSTTLIVLGVVSCTYASVNPSIHRHKSLQEQVGADFFGTPDPWYVAYMILLFAGILGCLVWANHVEAHHSQTLEKKLAQEQTKRHSEQQAIAAESAAAAADFQESGAPWGNGDDLSTSFAAEAAVSGGPRVPHPSLTKVAPSGEAEPSRADDTGAGVQLAPVPKRASSQRQRSNFHPVDENQPMDVSRLALEPEGVQEDPQYDQQQQGDLPEEQQPLVSHQGHPAQPGIVTRPRDQEVMQEGGEAGVDVERGEGGQHKEQGEGEDKAEEETVGWPRQLGFAYGFIAGMTGSQTVLEVKQAAALIELSFRDQSVLYGPALYFACVVVFLSATLQIHYCNQGMMQGESTVVLPCYYISWCVFGTLGGFAKFHEIDGFGPNQVVLFVVGFIIILLGAVLLSFDYSVEELTFIGHVSGKIRTGANKLQALVPMGLMPLPVQVDKEKMVVEFQNQKEAKLEAQYREFVASLPEEKETKLTRSMSISDPQDAKGDRAMVKDMTAQARIKLSVGDRSKMFGSLNKTEALKFHSQQLPQPPKELGYIHLADKQKGHKIPGLADIQWGEATPAQQQQQQEEGQQPQAAPQGLEGAQQLQARLLPPPQK